MKTTMVRALLAVLVLGSGLTLTWAAGSAGDLDSDYGQGGVADGGVFSVDHAVSLADGSIVMLGRSETGTPDVYPAVQKLMADGLTLDMDFGTNGIVPVFGSQAQLVALAVGPDGTIFVGGRRTVSSSRKGKRTTYVTSGSVLALNPVDGRVVTGFGSSGYVDTDGTVLAIDVYGTSSNYEVTVAFLAPVTTTTSGGGGKKGKKKDPDAEFAASSNAVGLLRVDATGSVDTSFGDSGVKIDNLAMGSDDVVRSMEIDAAGRVVVAIEQIDRTSNAREFWLSRYELDGDLDLLFGSSGRLLITDLGTVTDIAIDGDGSRILVASHDGLAGAHAPSVVRFNASGSATPVTTFDVPVLEHSSGTDDTWTIDLAVDASNRVYVGLWFGASASDFTVVRCNSDGTRDSGFGPDGDGIGEIADLAVQDQPRALFLSTDGDVLIGSNYESLNGSRGTAVVRWLGGN